MLSVQAGKQAWLADACPASHRCLRPAAAELEHMRAQEGGLGWGEQSRVEDLESCRVSFAGSGHQRRHCLPEAAGAPS